jgi:hypothetical protein
MKFIFHIFIISFFFSLSFSEDEAVTKVATSAANWLKIENGVRGISMGGSQVASGRGMTGTHYNPASITFLKGSEFFYSKSNYLADISHNTLAYGTRLSPADYFGLHLFYLHSGDMKVTNESNPDGTGETFDVTNLSLRLIYGRQLTDRLRIGGALKYIREDIFTAYMQSFVFDLGSNFGTGIYGLILGMSVSNFGPDVQFHGEGLEIVVADTTARDGKLSKITKKFSVPLTFRMGVQKDIWGGDSDNASRLTVSVDGINPIDYTVYGVIGLEYSWRDMAFIRCGTRLFHDTAGVSLGGGLKWNIFMVDYAYVNYGILKETHQFGISLEF